MSDEMIMPNGSQRWPEDPGEPTTGQPRISIAPEEGRFLRRLFRGKSVLEIGTGLGVSTSYLAQSAKWVHTIDPDPWVANTVWPELVSLYSNVSMDAIPAAERVLEATMFQGAFIDGSHRYLDVYQDVRYAIKTVQPGGWIVMHDAGHGDIAQAVLDNGYVMHVIKTTWQLGAFQCR